MFLLSVLLAVQVQSGSDVQRPKSEWEVERESMRPAKERHVWFLDHESTRPARGSMPNLISYQVNVDLAGNNIVGDAANEPSIAVDPTNPNRMAIGWRQFDNVASDFRQAGHAYSTNGGQTWTNNGPFTPGTFRSDPILASSPTGQFYYDSLLTVTSNDMWVSNNWGNNWIGPYNAYGGDKTWITVDQGFGRGRGKIYASWSAFSSGTGNRLFMTSHDGGQTFTYPVPMPGSPTFGSLCAGPNSEVYVAGTRPNNTGLCMARSFNAFNPWQRTTFDISRVISSTYDIGPSNIINPAGLSGMVWVGAAPTNTPLVGNVYVVATVGSFAGQRLSVVLFRSTDRGLTWSAPIRIDRNLGTYTNAFHWFGTMSVAPNGRLDVVWNDTGLDANQTTPTTCVTMYSYSMDGGTTWTTPQQLTIPWKFGVGYPQQNKIGDYYHTISQNDGVHLAFSATFNNEQDVYYMWIPSAN